MNAEQLGRTMMTMAGDLRDDKQCCEWARVGQMLTQLGSPRMPRALTELNGMDRAIVLQAIKQIGQQSTR